MKTQKTISELVRCSVIAAWLVLPFAGACDTAPTTGEETQAIYFDECDFECAGYQCGIGECGGYCGTCSGGETCSPFNQCECTPNCNGKVCGDDGCGGSCGSCSAGESCNGSGQCVCTPDCAGLQCGDDGCGGSCGTCTGGQACGGGQCTAPIFSNGFETAEESQWTNSLASSHPASSMYRTSWGTGDNHSGSHGQGISNHSYTTVYSPLHPVTAGQVLNGSIWVRGEISASSYGGYLFRAHWFNSAGTYLSNTSFSAATGSAWSKSSWTQVSGSATAPSGAAQVRIYLYFYMASGWVAFDDISVSGVPLQDTSFENGGYWIESPSGAFPASSIYRGTWGTAAPHTGSKALALSNQAYSYSYSSLYPVTPNQELTGKAWVRGNRSAESYGGILFRAYFYNAANAYITYKNFYTSTGSAWDVPDWTEIGKTLVVPANAAKVRIYLFFYMADGWMAWDDVTVSGIPLAGGDFENNIGWTHTRSSAWPGSTNARRKSGTGAPRSGTYSLSMGNQTYAHRYSGYIPVSPGSNYDGSAWVRGEREPSSYSGYRLEAGWYDSNYVAISTKNFATYSTHPLTTSWQQVNGSLTAPPGAAYMQVRVRNYQAGGWVNFDDIAVSLAGVCTPNCAGSVCGDDGCGGSCGDCTGGQWCNSGSCQGLANGQTCASSSACISNYCVDNVCCNSSCSNACKSCDAPGSMGTCVVSAAGTVCRDSAGPCDLVEVCNGSSGACPSNAYVTAGTGCNASGTTCSGSSSTCGGSSSGNDPEVCQ